MTPEEKERLQAAVKEIAAILCAVHTTISRSPTLMVNLLFNVFAKMGCSRSDLSMTAFFPITA